MSKYFSVRLPVKPYIRKYLTAILGEEIIIDQRHYLKIFMLILLEKEVINRHRFSNIMHDFRDSIVLWVNKDYIVRIGYDIPENRVISFNLFIEDYFCEALYNYVLYRKAFGINKKDAIEEFCDEFYITPSDVQYDSLRKRIDRLSWRYSFTSRIIEAHSKEDPTSLFYPGRFASI